jgi:peroxiredoxin
MENVLMALPEIGSVAPAFTLNNHLGRAVNLSDFVGEHVLLWFFPRAFGNN